MPHAFHERRERSALPIFLTIAVPSLALCLALSLGPGNARAAGKGHLGAIGAAGAATAAGTGGTAGAEMSLRSCVDGSPPIKVAVTAEQARLDAGDRQRFQSAAEARYPLYQRGGLQPAQVLMLRRGNQWQYVTLGQDGRSGGPCVTAVFAAERFAFTPAWLAKYQPRAGERDD